MTDDAQAHHSLSDLSPSGDRAGGFAGVLPSEERAGLNSSEPALSAPLVLGQFHGILTKQSSPTWPTFGTGFLGVVHPQVSTVNSTYFALPLPRIEALRNLRRSRELAREMMVAGGTQAPRTSIAIVAHSNGGVLALQVARELIGRGVPIRSLVLIAPALRTQSASREIGDWLSRGMLDHALLVRPTRDLVIGGISRNWRTKLYAWPWGSLGHDGWDLDELDPARLGCEMPMTIDLPDMRHSDPVAPANREWLYSQVICPALGLAPWGSLEPKEGCEA